MFTALRGLVCVGLLLAGCGGVRLPDPVVHEVDPEKGYMGDDIPVDIHGEGFLPQVQLDATRAGDAEVNSSFSAYLVPVEGGEPTYLESVSYQGSTRLSGFVPGGELLERGSYDLVVVGPTGATGRLDDAYTVTATRADRLMVTADEWEWTVNSTATVNVALVDLKEEVVADGIDVRVEVKGEDLQAGEVSFLEGGLLDQLDQGSQLLGRLRGDGTGSVYLTVSRPQNITVTVYARQQDSGILPGFQQLVWEHGPGLGLEFTLPEPPFTAEAGATFGLGVQVVDDFGNEVDDVRVSAIITDRCSGDLLLLQDLIGSVIEPVTLYEACEENAFELVWGLDPAYTPPSRTFEVEPGPVRDLFLGLSKESFVAGGFVEVYVTPFDEWDNLATFSPGNLTFSDSEGGAGEPVCILFEDQKFQYCQVYSEVAGEGIVLTAEDPAGASGDSQPYTVLPGAAAAVEVDPGSDPWVAGEGAVVDVSVLDRFGNVVHAEGLAPGDWALEFDGDGGSCTFDGGRVVAHFTCVTTVAGSGRVLTATVPSAGLSGESGEIVVHNGELTKAVVSVSSTTVDANDDVTLTIFGYDEWDNAYLQQSDPDLDLADSTGTISEDLATLTLAGSVSLDVRFTAAGTTTVVVSQDGFELGSSPPITVVAGEASALLVEPSSGWAWVGSGFEIDVTAVDDWGNVADTDDTATLSTASGVVDDTDLVLAAGEGTATLTWSEPALSEVVSAETDDLSGSSDKIAVVEDCGSSGPSIALSFGGSTDAVACFYASSGSASIAGSMAASTEGESSLAEYGLMVGGEWELSTSSSISLEVDEVGVYSVRALVADDAGCGDVASATGWVGPDDGEAVGPIELATADAEVEVGTSGTGTTAVSVDGAEDCAGDPAVGGTVYLRADRGEITGAAKSGEGLYLILDSNGDASATLDVTGASTGGTGTVYAWVDSGAALGEVSLDVDGDELRPVVWEQTPSGDELDLVDEILLRFSEDLLASSVTTARFDVSGTGGLTADVDSVTLDGDEVLVTLDSAVDGSAAAWTITASEELRDDSVGLWLDGEWSGAAGDYTGTFGDLSSGADQVDTCSVDTSTFRPDGDDASTGVAVEADGVTLSASSASTPTVWIFSVWDATGELIQREREAGTAAAESWTWDGRDVDELVVANGTYTLGVDTGDGSGNRGGKCSVQVTVDNRGGS